jgi:hypothetical protein
MYIGKSLFEMAGCSPLPQRIMFRVHATKRMFERGISQGDALLVIDKGSIIEEYPDDFPFPSVLINGIDSANKHLHCLVSFDRSAERFYIITVYHPDPEKWVENYSKRKHV